MIDFKQKMEEEEKREKHELLSQSDEELLINSKKRKRLTTYTIAIIAIALIFSGKVIMSSQNASGWFSENGVFGKLKHLVPAADNKLKGEENDRINILLLGMGGEGHDGAYLTDTMMVASFKPSTKQVALISLPRDMVSPVSNWRKINSINAYAEQKNPGSGGEVTSTAISDLLQIQIDYYVRVDFSGFSNVIDQLGGIQVNVENTLDDYSYPILGQEDNPNYYARFEHLHFDTGWQNMDGKTALKFARSRHAFGTEGSDFARARRQQLVLESVKNKLFSSRTLLNPVMITKLINEFSKNISTNISAWEAVRLWDLFQDVNHEQIINKVLSDAPDNFLISGIGEDGAYILTPRSGNFAKIRLMVQDVFLENTGTETKSDILETISDDAEVVILNGTWITGLAGKTAVTLQQSKFKILNTGNAPERNYSRTTAYDLSQGTRTKSLNVLKRVTGSYIAESWPEWVRAYQNANSSSSTPDFILVVGTDANKAE